jgi:hypothetical protein
MGCGGGIVNRGKQSNTPEETPKMKFEVSALFPPDFH